MNIYVSNLSFNVADEDLRDFFADYGEVSSAKVITDKFTGKSRGFGFVEMPDEEAAKKDSLYAYRYFKAHYWDGVNFYDERLARTLFF